MSHRRLPIWASEGTARLAEKLKSQKNITDDPKAKNIKTQNNLFVGSTKDLLKAIKNEDTKTIDVTPDDTSK